MEEKRKIVVLGHNGMLGQMAAKYFQMKGHSLHFVKHRFNAEERKHFIEEILQHPEAVILNCIGKIKQKTEDDNELLWANALLPLALHNHLLPSQTLVHPSTDCVFDGCTSRAYSPDESPNAVDTYGWSKRLGEVAVQNRPNTIIYRVSIIGPDNNSTGKGLLNWFLSNEAGAEIKGFENHYWNGITTLEWCKQIEKLLKIQNLKNKTLFEVGGTQESYTKYEILKLFQRYFGTRYSIQAFKTDDSVDRRMIPTIISENLQEQLNELVEFNFEKNHYRDK